MIVLCAFINSLCSSQNIELISPDSTGLNRINLIQAEKATITGKISDNKGNPLMYASVFISNTTLGTTSNKNGEYEIKNVPFGYHKIIASFLGYESEMIPLDVKGISITQNLQLKEQTLAIDEVTIQSEKGKNKWKQNFKKFEKNFIGRSDHAPSCKIINPKVLLFHFDKESRILTAKARETLFIENFGLGYTIHFVLAKFELRRDGSCTYLGSAHFTPMIAENKSIAESWKTNRKRAYIGSLQHFLRTLTNESLVEEGFVVQSCSSMYPVEYEEDVDNILIGHRNPLGSELLVYPGRFQYERRFWFNNILHIAFTEEAESHAYGTTIDPRYTPKTFQQSWIRLLKEGTLFNNLGYLNDPESLIVHGYWAFERESEALPNDYYPED